MSSYNFPTDTGGLRIKYGPWDIGMWLQPDNSGLGHIFVLGDLDANGWNIRATLDGPMFEGQWISTMQQAGGMGNYAFSKLPAIRSVLKHFYDLTPDIPPLTNQTPFSVDAFNEVWGQFFVLKPATEDTYPNIVPKF